MQSKESTLITFFACRRKEGATQPFNPSQVLGLDPIFSSLLSNELCDNQVNFEFIKFLTQLVYFSIELGQFEFKE